MEEFDFAHATYKDLRHLFASMDAQRDSFLLPPIGVTRITDQDYALDGCPEHTLDVYYPEGTEGKLPVIFNIHGGGWTYGNKGQYQYYCMSLVQKGFTVINMNYRLAPESRFPAALEDICSALSYVQEHQIRYHCDMERFCVIGDSAGAQLASQICILLTNPEYRELFDLDIPELNVKAAVLNCGLFNVKEAFFSPEGGLIPPATDYLPSDVPTDQLKEQMDIFRFVTGDFPKTYLMGSVNDPISLADTDAFEERLKSKGVEVQSCWYGKDDPSLAHVFHLNISLPAAKQCNDLEVEYLIANI